ncbi:MAG: histone deacetylase [Steroidobacteraceae bacterium]|jgi:acetoin utilization deacetylase AcuC-like enzyme
MRPLGPDTLVGGLFAMKCCYHPGYHVALPAGHPFPISKYQLLKEGLLREGLVAVEDLITPQPLGLDDLALVHTREYLAKLESGTLSVAEQRRLGMPWSDALWKRSRLSAGGTLLAARLALEEGIAGNLAGGTHHAFPDHAEGFCVLNDVAIAITKLRAEGKIQRAAVVDLDVHQGNGTAAIFEGSPEVVTFSMHGERNYPLAKMRSTVDVPLADGTDDGAYIEALDRHLPEVLDGPGPFGALRPDIVFYLAGVDIAVGDRFGKLAVSEDGIRRRDCRVIDEINSRGIPFVIVLGGGYASSPARTAELHAHAFRAAVAGEPGLAPLNSRR